ncbi:MAG: phosphatidate cytidylyltransferase [Pontibacterium sp.]
MLKARVITALVLAPLALWMLFGLALEGFMIALDGILLLAAWEWSRLSGLKTWTAQIGYVAFTLLLLCGLHLGLHHAYTDVGLVLASAFWLFASICVVRYPNTQPWASSFVRLLLGICVLIPTWVAFFQLKAANSDLQILLLLFIVWSADIGAYAAGKNFGKNKLAPHVSPGKTREGLYGGLVSCAIVGFVFSFFFELSFAKQLALVALVAFCGLVSVMGDLFESMLKRHQGMKDSSQLLPGHGGILDRIDSLVAAAPIYVLGTQFLIF